MTLGNNTNISIDINGKRYDAVTGTFIGAVQPTKPAVRPSMPARAGSIDGFRRVSRTTGPAALAPQQSSSSSPRYLMTPAPTAKNITKPVTKPATPRAAHVPGINVAPHTPQRASTLMRSAVQKPVITSPAVIKAQTRTDLLATAPMQTVAPKISFNSVNTVRNQRAERMIKSSSVSRYSRPFTPLAAPVQPLAAPITPRPVALAMPTAVATNTSPRPQARTGQAMNASMSEIRVVPPTGNRTTSQYRAAAPSQRPAVPSHSPSANRTDIFEQALADARSHEQTYDDKKPRTKKKHGMFRVLAGSAAAVAALGFIVYYNAPSLNLAVASYRAGLHATLPASQPNGFKVGYLDYKPGDVTVNYTSPADSRQFNISQKASSWDSQALLSNFVSSAGSAYKTYQRAGRTVYLLGNNTATWVDSGIWYTVDGNSSLSQQQLLQVAGSM